jgi:sarcosine oxidase subunit beta
VNILIIGGGMVGCATAFYLSRYGHDVTLIERREIASEASGVNSGGVGGPGWGPRPTLQDILSTGGLALFRELQLDLGYEIEFRQSGRMLIIQNEAEYEFARDQVLARRHRGYQMELLDMREARSLEPELNPALYGAVYMSLCGHADPVKASRAFADAAEKTGARIITNCTVTGVTQEQDGSYLLTTTAGPLSGEALVMTAGAWSAQLGKMLGLHIPIMPVRGQMWSTPPLPPTLFTMISAVESRLAWHLNPGNTEQEPPNLTHRDGKRVTRNLYGRQARTGELIFGGDQELVGFDKAPDPEGIRINRMQAQEILPCLDGVPVARTWAGLLPFSLDGKPLLGAIPLRPKLYIADGMASSGFGRRPMAAKLLADTIHQGSPPHVLQEASPARCVREL